MQDRMNPLRINNCHGIDNLDQCHYQNGFKKLRNWIPVKRRREGKRAGREGGMKRKKGEIRKKRKHKKNWKKRKKKNKIN